MIKSPTRSNHHQKLPPPPDGPMTVRAACRWLGSHVTVLKLYAVGEITGQTVHTAAGGKNIQIFGESIREYLARQGAC
jgi:hypothetical protein